MTTKHTPGPWLRGDSFDGHKITFSHPCSALTPIADVWTGIGRDEAEANARLIAAAPELLEALEAMFNASSYFKYDFPACPSDEWATDGVKHEAWLKARAALSKAQSL